MIVYKVKRKSYIADLYVPTNPNDKVVVLVPGLPKSTNIDKLVKVFLDSNCVVLYPNFSGMQDSGGALDGQQSIKDVREFIKWGCQKQLTEIYYGEKINLGTKKKIILAGMSFGATPTLLAVNQKVERLILLSPALIFNQKDIKQIIDFDFNSQMKSLINLIKKAFPYTYRIKSEKSFK